MKKALILPIFIISLLVLPTASATILDWLTGRSVQETTTFTSIIDWLTGRSVEETTTLAEQVSCLFANSDATQKCYTDDGAFSCSGVGSCVVSISGEKDKQLSWKSSCGGEFSTVIDGMDESTSFNCPQLQPAPTPTQPVVEEVKERIKCVFLDSASPQKCYTSDERFSCSGTESCETEVHGGKGNALPWKSSCGGYGMTIIDSNNEELKFNCEQTYQQPIQQYPTQEPATKPVSQPIITPAPAEQPQDQIKEFVKCIFTDSDSGQYCYTEDKRFGCKGVGACAAESFGRQGEKLIWKSSCESYTETIIDGITDYAPFKCKSAAQLSSPAQPVQILPAIKEKVKCLFVNAQTPQLCVNEYPDSGCKGVGSCIDEDVTGEQGKKMVWKSSCGGGYAYTVMDGEDEYVEFTCPQTQTPPTVQEQVTCFFANADSAQKCYTDDEKYVCSSSGEIYTKNVDGQEVRYSVCKADVSGEQGQKLTWKSSCGGYGYTVIDGSAEDAEFSCVPSNEVRKEQISGKGFKGAYWQCYDGFGKPPVVSVSTVCKPSEVWQEEASEFCSGHCHEDTESGVTKCGVNSFSVTENCYVEYGKEGVEFVPPPEHTFKEETSSEGFFVPGDGSLFYFYTDDCRYCQGMDEVIKKVGSRLGVSGGFIDFNNRSYYGTLFEKMGITAVPTVVYKRGDERFIKRTGSADVETLIAWLQGNEAVLERKPAELPEEKKKELLICKDSCPSQGKCYPFGYRKEGKFCSDNGAFVEQLSEDNNCDNNFECSTNVCVDGKCMSSGLIQDFLSWFKKLFR